MVDRFGVPGAFAAYHAGPARYAAHVRQGVSLPPETRRYVAQLSAAVDIEHEGVPATNPLFAIRSEEHTSELPSLMRISYAVFCLKHINISFFLSFFFFLFLF